MITRESRRKGTTVTFTLLTEEAVSVVGDFNGWDPHVHPLPLGGDGTRSTTIELEPGRYAFRYLADGGRFFDDPEADFLESNGLGDSHGVLEIDLTVDDDEIDLTAPAAPAWASPAEASPAAASDDIERIEGIGPKIAQALRDHGLATFAALAGASDDRLREALGAAQLRFAPSLGTWAEQAALLAAGDEEGFAALTAKLTAGRPAKAKAPKAVAASKASKPKADKGKPKKS
jgi:predicted flap endonuclease-1-like 5' DNA nuclease